MANPEHVVILKQGVEVWNSWREENPQVKPDLESVYLREQFLPNINFEEANLHRSDLDQTQFNKANLSHANLKDASLERAHLEDANLVGSNLQGVNFVGANLSHANLSKSNLSGIVAENANFEKTKLISALLEGANLINVNFSHAMLGHTILANVDLSQCHHLHTCLHQFPSTIGIDTVYQSKGMIPHPFLLGCGVPEKLIHCFSSLGVKDFEFQSCFLSYATLDQRFVEMLNIIFQGSHVHTQYSKTNSLPNHELESHLEKEMYLLLKEHFEQFWQEIMEAGEEQDEWLRRILEPFSIHSFAGEILKPYALQFFGEKTGQRRIITNEEIEKEKNQEKPIT